MLSNLKLVHPRPPYDHTPNSPPVHQRSHSISPLLRNLLPLLAPRFHSSLPPRAPCIPSLPQPQHPPHHASRSPSSHHMIHPAPSTHEYRSITTPLPRNNIKDAIMQLSQRMSSSLFVFLRSPASLLGASGDELPLHSRHKGTIIEFPELERRYVEFCAGNFAVKCRYVCVQGGSDDRFRGVRCRSKRGRYRGR